MASRGYLSVIAARGGVVNLTQGLFDLVAVALVAALTPIVVALLPGPRVPQVVVFLIGGIVIGRASCRERVSCCV